MLSKRQRLTTEAFNAAFSSGRRCHTPYFQAIIASSHHFHGAVVVGKKVYKKAVDRNRLRRQVYGVLYRTLRDHTDPITIILIAKPAMSRLPRRAVAPTVNVVLEHCHRR